MSKMRKDQNTQYTQEKVRDGVRKNTQSDAVRAKEVRPAVMSFESVYRECGDRVLNLVYRFTRDEEVARDLTQDIFIRVYQNLSSFREESRVTTWVYRIAVNHCLNYLKHARRRRWINMLNRTLGEVVKNEDDALPMNTRSNDPGPDQIVENDERDRIILRAIESLPVKYRVPFQLYRDEEMSYREIADVMNISLSAVETRIHRARKQLIVLLRPWRNQIL